MFTIKFGTKPLDGNKKLIWINLTFRNGNINYLYYNYLFLYKIS